MCVNRISEILKEKGLEKIRPSKEKLEDLGTTVYTWNWWVEKKADPELHQLEPLADFLGCAINELIERKEVAA